MLKWFYQYAKRNLPEFWASARKSFDTGLALIKSKALAADTIPQISTNDFTWFIIILFLTLKGPGI